MLYNQLAHKIISVFSSISLLLQSFSPFVYLIPPTSASEPLKAEVAFDNSTNKFEVKVNTNESVDYRLVYRTDKQNEALQGLSEKTPGTNFQKLLYAGTCSTDDVCTLHTVIRGIFKVEVKAQNWITAQKFSITDGVLIIENEYNPENLDLNELENFWLEHGTEVKPTVSETPSPTVIVTPTATIVPTSPVIENGEILEEAASTQVFSTPRTDGVVETTVTQSYVCRADSLNGCLVTDKPDYAPTDIAIISGYGFAPNTEYTLNISSEGLTWTYQIMTDSSGAFTYSYQLDGTYRPNYGVELKDLNGTVVATTSFTDSPVPSNKIGITMYGFVMSGSYSLVSSQPTGTGQIKNGNVGTYPEGACIPVEVEVKNNDNITGDIIISPVYDYFSAVIGIDHLENITYSGTGNPRLTSTNLNNFNYSNSELSSGSFVTSSGTQSYTVSGPFSGNNAGTTAPTATDSQRHYNISMIGVPSGTTVYVIFCAKLNIDASQYNGGSAMSVRSAQGGNENVPIPVNQILQLPSLTLTKVVDSGTATPDQWSFNISPSINGITTYSIPSGQNSIIINNISPNGNYSITESGPSGYAFASGSGTNCTYNGSIATSTVAAGNPPTNASCTFHNAQQTGSIELKKVWSGTGGQTTLNIGSTVGGTEIASQQTGVAGGIPLTTGVKTVNTGTYYVSETGGLANYDSSLSCTKNGQSYTPGASNALVVTSNDAFVCTFTNTLKTGTIVITKNTSGGDGSFGFSSDVPGQTNFSLTTSGNTASTTFSNVVSGSYKVTETVLNSMWDFDSVICTDPSNDSTVSNTDANINLSPGETVSCTYSNIKKAKLTVIKHVNNNYGGTLGASSFTLHVTKSSTDVTGSPAAGSETGVTYNLVPGTYVVSENTPPSGYEQTSISGQCDSSTGSITLAAGDEKTCTITNSDIQPKLIVIKHVVNDNGGLLEAKDFEISILGDATPSSFAGEESPGTEVLMKAGNYSVSEKTVSGYTPGYSTDCSGSLAVGQTKTCTITNDDQPGTLIVKKIVNNDTGGKKTVIDFTFQVNGGSAVTFEADGQNDLTVNAGEYSVTEPPVSGYSTVYDNCTKVAIPNGGTATCTITNTAIAPKLKLVKSVTADNGGNKVPADWDLTATGSVLGFTDKGDSSTYHTVQANVEYTLSESAVTGYDFVNWVCTGGGTFTSPNKIVLDLAEEVTCTATNNDVAPKLTLIKKVITDDGGNEQPDDFKLTVGGTGVLSGAITTLDAHKDYVINETVVSGYSFVEITGDAKCPAKLGDAVNLNEGDNITCTITNDDITPSLTLIKEVSNNNGGIAGVNDFGLSYGGTPATSGQKNTVKANTSYAIDETGLTGYSFVEITGDAKCPELLKGTVTLDEGEDLTCTIKNDDNIPSLKLIKSVKNDNGGTNVANDWTLYASGPTSFSGDGTVSSDKSFSAGTYALSESGPTGYAASTWNCTGGKQVENRIEIALGENVECTIVNDDIAPKLTVIKTVTNDNGGNKVVSDFTLYIDSVSVLSGVATEVLANKEITVSEDSLFGYEPSVLGTDCADNGTITLKPGENKTCSITNDDIAPKLTLIKIVINDNGGDATVNQFGLTVGGNGVSSGETKEYTSNTAYAINESGKLGYSFVSISGDKKCPAVLGGTLTLVPGDDISCSITNDDQPGELTVIKHVINDNDGTKTASDFTMNVAGTNVSDSSFPGDEAGTKVTLDAGAYEVTESVLSGYKDSYDNCSGTIKNGESRTCTITNDDQFGKVIVLKFDDKDGDGIQDPGEQALKDWVITLSQNPNQKTDNQGQVVFNPLLAGTYTLNEVMQSGWEQTGINCSNQNNEEPTPTPTPPNGEPTNTPTPTPTDGATPTPTNTPTPTPEPSSNICHWNEGPDKWNALSVPLTNNGHEDHSLDFEYKGTVDSNGHPVHDSQTTDPALDGDLWCKENDPRLQTFNVFGVSTVHAATTEPEGTQITVRPEQTVNCVIGNRYITPELQIYKSNNATGDKSPGDEVTYTIKVKAVKNPVYNLRVVDLLPNGFTYKGGSALAVSSNPLKGTLTLPVEPSYHSPGTWTFPTGYVLETDEILTLTLIGKVSSSIKAGLYRDVAWAEGTETSETTSTRVLAQAQPEGYVTPLFVGTKVNINKDTQQGADVNIVKEEGQVLGASTSLPATGAKTIWMLIMMILSVFGFLGIVSGLMIKHRKLFAHIVVAILFITVLALIPQSAYAGDLSIRLAQPKSPTYITDFSLTFVTLDLSSTPTPITVKCYKKWHDSSDSDAGFTQFGSDIAVDAGGNTADCPISGVVSKNGTYEFYATATNGTDNATSVDEGLISVDYNTSGPGTPSSYTKDQISSCEYKIKFRTADDGGKTVKVEIYSAASTSFGLDGGTRVGIIDIGSNTEGTFSHTVPDCNRPWYFVIRAFDKFGNGSGTIGDIVTKIISSTTSTTTQTAGGGGAIPVSGVTIPGAAGGQVLGEKTSEGTEEGSVLGEEATGEGKPEVIKANLGQNIVKTITDKKFIIVVALLGLVLLGVGVYFYRSRKDKVV